MTRTLTFEVDIQEVDIDLHMISQIYVSINDIGQGFS